MYGEYWPQGSFSDFDDAKHYLRANMFAKYFIDDRMHKNVWWRYSCNINEVLEWIGNDDEDYRWRWYNDLMLPKVMALYGFKWRSDV